MNGNQACSATAELDGLRYQVPDGGSFVYQAGGIWKATDDGKTTRVADPDVSFRGGVLQISAVDFAEGKTVSGAFEVQNYNDASSEATLSAEEHLFSRPTCERPQEIRVTVTSGAFAEQWHAYFQQSMPNTSEVSYSPGSNTTSVVFDGDDLPSELSQGSDKVVDFTNQSTPGKIADRDDDGRAEAIFDGPGANTYNASLEYLTGQVGQNKTTYTSQMGNHGPHDVVVVVDESLSMGQPSSKVDTVETAVESSLSYVVSNDSVALLAYDEDARLLQPLTTDHQIVEQSVNFDTGGDRYTTSAVEAAIDHLLARGNPQHPDEIILLSDGENEDTDPLADQIQRANANGISVNTLALDSGGTDYSYAQRLKHLATETGGTYHGITTPGSLSFYMGIAVDDVTSPQSVPVVDKRLITHNPTVFKMMVGNQEYWPWTKYTSDYEAAYEFDLGTDGHLGYPNDGFQEFEFTVQDGESIDFTHVRTYTCTDNVTTGETESPSFNNSKVYHHARCTGSTGYYSHPSNYQPTVFVDGDAIPNEPTQFWQENLSESIPERYTEDANDDGRPDTFDLERNQAVVVFDNTVVDGSDANDLVFLLEAGKSWSSGPSRWVIDMDVDKFQVEDE